MEPSNDFYFNGQILTFDWPMAIINKLSAFSNRPLDVSHKRKLLPISC